MRGLSQPNWRHALRAGGLTISTTFGSLTTPNITPDPDTGIGHWSDEEFYRAVTDGIGHHGEYLYPAMPFTSYTKMMRSDVLAIKAYLFSLKPVYAPCAPDDMAFPFDIRWTLVVWRELYFYRGIYQPRPNRSAQWNRGAYSVEGPGHCGECHSPRNIFGATETQHSLAGGEVGIEVLSKAATGQKLGHAFGRRPPRGWRIR